MGILKWLSGPSPEKLEQTGDALSEDDQWGQAKLTYERALGKLSRATSSDAEQRCRIEQKINATRQALAQAHRDDAEAYIEGGHFDDAREMLYLAIEVSPDDRFKQQQEERLSQFARLELDAAESISPEDNDGETAFEHDDHRPTDEADEEYFSALCGTLPDDVQQAYSQYGEDFKAGYIALNRGQFEIAYQALSDAMAQHVRSAGYIPLELASACLNLDRLTEARQLLEGFVDHHPGVLPAYTLLCEIYWDQQAFDRAEALLQNLPPELSASVAGILLKGETLYRSGRLQDARQLYDYFIAVQGWNASVVEALAKCHEALDQPAQARELYKQMLDHCTSCRSQVDPAIRHRYAELSFAANETGSDLLELYLALAREIPGNAAHYFSRVSQLYAAQGHTREADRFRALARDAPRANDN